MWDIIVPEPPRLCMAVLVLVKVCMDASYSKVAKGVAFGPPKWGDHDGAHGESTTASTGVAWGLTVGLGAAG